MMKNPPTLASYCAKTYWRRLEKPDYFNDLSPS
ncbi:hypothetical protein R69919_03152 [Paraburkholderia gardini]|nr:hypothetical protein R69919_03152 [Paraburkholderia gardini]